MLSQVAHVCNPVIWEIEAGGSQVQDQPGQHTEIPVSKTSTLKRQFSQGIKCF
jgi:hypothetical protein